MSERFKITFAPTQLGPIEPYKPLGKELQLQAVGAKAYLTAQKIMRDYFPHKRIFQPKQRRPMGKYRRAKGQLLLAQNNLMAAMEIKRIISTPLPSYIKGREAVRPDGPELFIMPNKESRP